MEPMMIKGKKETYKVKWVGYGFSGAASRVYSKRWYGWKMVYDHSDGVGYNQAERMKPKGTRYHFERAVQEYEGYSKAWNDYAKGIKESLPPIIDGTLHLNGVMKPEIDN